jgi:hypothetical protein
LDTSTVARVGALLREKSISTGNSNTKISYIIVGYVCIAALYANIYALCIELIFNLTPLLSYPTTGAQFLLVSHRPEMHEYASRMIGLYIHHDMPHAISLGFKERGQL